jgi:hypothetical protein
MAYISNSQRDAAEEHLTPVQLSLYEGRAAGRQLRSFANEAGITSERAYTIYAIAVGDMILGLVPRSSREQIRQLFEERLPGLNDDQLDGLAIAIENYLAPLDDDTGVLSTQQLDAEINNLETTMSRLQTLRTMSDDMHTAKEEVVHRSSQDDILQNSAKSEASSTTPRWGSDT